MKPRTRNALLWTVQVLLAALFLFAGYAKLDMSGDILAKATGLPATFMRFIAVCELLGAIGLVLPGLLKIRRSLTPLAASGLAIIMVGATTLTLMEQPAVMAVLPFITGVLATLVARARRHWREPVLTSNNGALRRAA